MISGPRISIIFNSSSGAHPVALFRSTLKRWLAPAASQFRLRLASRPAEQAPLVRELKPQSDVPIAGGGNGTVNTTPLRFTMHPRVLRGAVPRPTGLKVA